MGAAALEDGGPEPAIRIDVEPQHDVPIVVTAGVLDSFTYRILRDAVIEAAVNAPPAVIVDINRLCSPSPSAWTVFTSARWHVSTWPDVQILLVCAEPQTQTAITAAGITRCVPLHSTRELALDAVRAQRVPTRKRIRTNLPRSREGIELARGVVSECLTNWGRREVLPAVATVATVFVENVLDHTQSAPVLIVEQCQDTITVAVEDNCSNLPGRHEDTGRGVDAVSGLAIVSALCRVWGSAPTSSGKSVWALISHESRF